MKIRGVELSIAVQGSQFPPAMLGVIPLDIEVPEELTKTDWTPLEVIVTVLTSKSKSSGSIRVHSMEQDMNFRIDQTMIAAAILELNKRIDAKRAELTAGPAEGGPNG
jgi:hypothetical protein